MDMPPQPQAPNTSPVSPAPAPFAPPVAATPTPVATPPPSGSHTGLLVGTLVALFVLAAAAYYFFFRTSGDVAVVSPSQSEAATPTPTESPSPIKIFTSEALGFRFEYVASQGNPVIEQGDKVFVGGPEGQWVQEFTKLASDDFKTAIAKKFLAGIPPSKCPIVVEPVAGMPSISMATINYDFQMTTLEDPRIGKSPCPAAYGPANGLRYFWYDAAHPDKFFFFSIGQYAIMAEEGTNAGLKTWQDTFEVIR